VAIELAFQLADPKRQGAIHPFAFLQSCKQCPSSAKVVSGESFYHEIKKTRIEMTLSYDMASMQINDVTDEFVVDRPPGHLHATTARPKGSLKGSNIRQPQLVVYELPITIQEIIAIYLLEV
jgi:hypothetical protein